MGEKIKELMDEKGISAVKLGDAVGVSDVHIGYIIKGFKNPSVALLKRIADTLEVTVDELLG